jgi:hypothetical protein
MVGLHSCNPIMWKKLSHFGFSDCQPDSTPYGPSVLLRKKPKNNKRSIEIFQNNWFAYVIS